MAWQRSCLQYKWCAVHFKQTLSSSSWHLWCIESAEVQDGRGGSANCSLKDIGRECAFCLRMKTEVLVERRHSGEGDAQLSAHLNRTSWSREESSITRVEINESETNTSKTSRLCSIFIQMIKSCIMYSKNLQRILPRLQLHCPHVFF